MKTVVVLGANSFSGQDFVDLLLETGRYRVIGISRSPERSALFLKYKTRANLSQYEYHALDLNRDIGKILSLLDTLEPWGIVNFAAQSEVAPSWIHPEHWFQTNTVSQSLLVNHLRQQSYLQRYLHISSPEAYGSCEGIVREGHGDNPSTPYAASKAAADMINTVYFKQYGFPLITVRATNVYGARQQLFKIIPRSFISIKLNKKIQLHGGGVAVKSYIHIRDVSEGELLVLEKGTVGDMYHLSPPVGVSVRNVVETICAASKVSFDTCVDVVEERPGQDKAYVIDSTKAQTELGWSAKISLSQGLQETRDWVEAYWSEIQKEPLEYLHKA